MQSNGRLHTSAALTRVTSSIPTEQGAGWAPARSLITVLTEPPRLPQQIVQTFHIPELDYYVTVYIITGWVFYCMAFLTCL
jgi:hypothetical protein